MNNAVTFRQIEQQLGSAAHWASSGSALEDWYERVRDRPLTEFSDEDLSRSCRQDLYLDFVAPFAVERIEVNPLAGEMYDGELLVALAAVTEAFWSEHKSLAQRLGDVLTHPIETDYEDVTNAIRTLRERLVVKN